MNKLEGIEVIENATLKNYNTYKIDAKARYLVKVLNLEGLIKVLKYLKENDIPYFIMGNGSNVILDDYFKGAVIRLDGLKKLEIEGDIVKAMAGVMMGVLANETIKANLSGLEWAINIPGMVGGSIVGNAGAYNSEIFDNLVSIKVIDENLEIKELKKEEIKYEYRHTSLKKSGLIVVQATFKLEKGDYQVSKQIIEDRCERRKATQPLDMPSAGSVFRNPPDDYAGRLIEEAGLKGKRIGGAEVSNIHANFIVNTGNATSNDIKSLIKLVHEEVKRKFNIDLVLEQEIIEWM